MEKYARWNDPGSLVNPFVPANIYAPVSLYLSGAVLVLLRLPFLLVAGILLGFGSILCVLTSPVRPLARLLQRLVEGPAARLVLFVLGYWSVDAEYAQRAKLRLRSAGAPARVMPVGACVQPGDIVVCNLTSWVDALWLTYRFGPVFAVATGKQVNGSPSVASCGIWGIIARFAKNDLMRAGKNPVRLVDLANRGKGLGGHPVCVFPEGVATNGSGVLKFHDVFGSLDFDDQRVHTLGFSPSVQRGTQFSSTMPVGSLLKHVLWHCLHGAHSLRVSMLPAAELTAPPSVQSTAAKEAKRLSHLRQQIAARAQSGAYGGGIEPPKEMRDPGVLGNRVRDLMAKMLQVEALTRCSKDFPGFHSYWLSEQSGVRTGTRDENIGSKQN